MMGISGKDKSALGLKQLRTNCLYQLPIEKKRRLVRVMRNIIMKEETCLLPQDGKSLVSAALEEIGNGLKQSHILLN